MIPAGGSGKLVAKVTTHANQSGHLKKSVLVETDEQGAKPLRLQLEFTVEAPLITEPAGRAVLDVVTGQKASTTVTLRRRDGKPLTIGAVVATPPDVVTTELVPTGDDASPDARELRVEASAGEDAVTRMVTLTIPTNLDGGKSITYPLVVRVHPVLEIEPRQVRFVVGEPGQSANEMSVRILDNSGRSFRVTGVKSSNPELFVGRVPEGGAASQHQLTVALAPGLASEQVPGVVRGEVTVTTDDPAGARVTIPVLVARSAAARRMPKTRRARPSELPRRPTTAPPAPYQGGSR